MKIKPGCAEEYRKRHDAIWPELVAVLRQSGIIEYHIFLDEETLSLFAFQKKSPAEPVENLAQHPVMRLWWTYMADLMEVNFDDSPVVVSCKELFRLQ